MTHSVPTRRSSDLPTPATCRAGSHSIEALSFISGSRCLRPLCLLLFDATSPHVPAAIGERERDPHHKYPHGAHGKPDRSEEHTSELQSLMRISYAVFCLNTKNNHYNTKQHS